jgi:hypothetical protein
VSIVVCCNKAPAFAFSFELFALLFEFIVKTWEMFPEVIDTSFEKVLWNKEFLFNILL